MQTPGGSYKVVDSTTFTASKTIAMVEVTVEVGGMRRVSLFSFAILNERLLWLRQGIARTYDSWGSVKHLLTSVQWHPTQPEWGFFL